MWNKNNLSNQVRRLTAIIIFSVFIIWPLEVMAKATVIDIEGINYNVNLSMKDNLVSLVGKRVSITTTSGKTLSGVVKDVGTHLIHVEKLEGKEYFDALIRLKNINSIESRFRKIQR